MNRHHMLCGENEEKTIKIPRLNLQKRAHRCIIMSSCCVEMNGKIELRLFQALTIINHGGENMPLQETIQNVNFSKVGSTNLKPMDIKNAIVKEKLSFLILPELKKKELPQNLYYSRLSCLYEDKEVKSGVIDGKKKYYLNLLNPYCLSFYELDTDPAAHGNIYFVEVPKFQSIRAGASFEEISLFDATRKDGRFSDSDRIEELLNLFGISDDDVYTNFKISKAFKLQKFPTRIPRPQKKTCDTPESEASINACVEGFVKFQRELVKWFKGGFPRRYDLYDLNLKKLQRNFPYPSLPSPIFYRPLGYMAYDVQPHKKYQPMRLQRLFFNPDGCGLRETLIPTIFIHERFEQYPVMTGLPNTKQVPLWNVDRIMKKTTDTVVICGCIQDAEALSRYNATSVENLVFTSFVDVGEKLELIDFSPLNGKNVVFLISNHNGNSLTDAYIETDKVYRYLRGKTKLKAEKKKLIIPEFAFVQRKVEYPDSSSTIATPEELASTYYKTQPKIVPESTFPKFPLMGEYGFATQFAKVLDPSSDSSVFVKDQKEIRKKKKIDISRNAIIRSLLYHGEITLLAGYSGSGKSRFCQTLIRYIVNGDDKMFLKERFWTRCSKKTPMKIVYWNYDGVSGDVLEQWEDECLDGLTVQQKKNIFIDQAPRWWKDGGFHKDSGQPIFELYKNLLNEYTNKGFNPGHPVDLLIVDTLSTVWKREKTSDTLLFLNGLTKAIPSMAVLAIHHTTDLGRPLGGCAAEEIPRVVLILKKIKKPILDNSISLSEDTEDMEFFKMWYDKNNNISLEEEKLPFICVRKSIDQYDVLDSACTREEMFDVLRRHYGIIKKCSNEVTGRLLGYSERTIRDRDKRKPIIDAKTYGEYLKKISEKGEALKEKKYRWNKPN